MLRSRSDVRGWNRHFLHNFLRKHRLKDRINISMLGRGEIPRLARMPVRGSQELEHASAR